MADNRTLRSGLPSKRSATAAKMTQTSVPKKQKTGQSSSEPQQVDDFTQFITDHPGQEAKAYQFDNMARMALKDKYFEFNQDTYKVIERRTGEVEPDELVEPGPRDPKSTKGHPKYLCSECNVYKFDIKRHLEIHNKHPALAVYCPVCLMPMSRDDTCTLPEHVLKKHPEYIFGGEDHALLRQARIVEFSRTFNSSVLGRLNAKAIRKYIDIDHKVYTGERTGEKALDKMSKEDLIEYLCAIRMEMQS